MAEPTTPTTTPARRASGLLARILGGSAYGACEEARQTRELERERLMAACASPDPAPEPCHAEQRRGEPAP